MARRWTKIGAGVAGTVTTILGLFLLLQTNFGFEIIDLTGNFSCEGTYENPCISEFLVKNPTRYDVDIFNQNEIQLDFSPDIKDYALFTKDGRCSATGSCRCELDNGQKIGFKGWRCVDFTNATKPRQDKVYVFRFPKYSEKEFRLVGIKNNPQDVIKWGFGANEEYLDPIWDSQSWQRTRSTETINNQDGTNNLVIYSGIRFVQEDSTWKKIEDARSLKGSGIECIVKKDKENDPEVECLDYNYTSIKIDVKDKKSYPIKIYYKNQTLKSEKSEKSLDIETIKINFGDKVHVGKNSTTIQLIDSSTENLADITIVNITNEQIGSQIKFNITAVPSSQIIDSSIFCGFIVSNDESIDSDVRMWRVDDQSWDEGSSPGTIDSQVLTNQTDDNFTSASVGVYSCVNVTKMIQTDYSLSNSNASLRFVDLDVLMSTISTIDNNAGISFGSFDGQITMDDRENSEGSGNLPYLNITFSEPSTGFKSPSATGDDFNDWTNPTNAFSSNNLDATATAGGFKEQDYYNFNLGVPASATINGIEVAIEGAKTSVTGRIGVELSWDGGSSYTSTFKEEEWSGTTGVDETKTYGGASDEWGRTWDDAEFSNTNFRLKIQNPFSTEPPSVDHIQVKVYYTEAPPGDTCTYPGSGNWDITCSDNCLINSPIDIDGNIIIQGAGKVVLTSTLNFNSTVQKIVIQDSTCKLIISSGGKII